MNKEKQIREMSNLIYENRPIKYIWNEDADSIAETLYNAGYRKQGEGEWEKRRFIIFDSEKVGYRCSECNTTWDAPTKFCPNCGAKMKGEEKKEAQKKYFSPEDVRKMSPSEVRANYQAILDSMKKWK